MPVHREPWFAKPTCTHMIADATHRRPVSCGILQRNAYFTHRRDESCVPLHSSSRSASKVERTFITPQWHFAGGGLGETRRSRRHAAVAFYLGECCVL